MRMDKKGDIGFMEAMAAAMAVTLVLTAFIGAVAIHAGGQEDVARGVDIDALADRISISDGRIEGDLGEELRFQIQIGGVGGHRSVANPRPAPRGDPDSRAGFIFRPGRQRVQCPWRESSALLNTTEARRL